MNLSNLETYKGKDLQKDAEESIDFTYELNLILKEHYAKNYRICQYHCVDCK